MIKTNTHLGEARRLQTRILIILLMFVALPLQMWGADYYQGVRLTKPSKSGDVYLITNRSELLYWAVKDQNKDIRLMADINVQGSKQLLKADGKTLAMSEKDIVVWPYLYYRASKMTIEGNNHTISGIYQKNGYGVNKGLGSYKEYDYVGFISWTMTQTIITDLNIADSYLVGKYAGGFIGQKSKSSSMALSEYKNCSFRGYVKGEKYAGGHTGWYRTDGQDASFYRCFNYGIIESGKSFGKDTDTGAGGLIGYLDITHTSAAKANTHFNRCVNYGNITCFTPGGNVGGIIGKVWDNNNGKREWRFCFNFGDVTKYDLSKKSLVGSGLLGNYSNSNGKAQPKILGCGNAKKTDTGALLDSLSWNFKDHEPFVVAGSKTNVSSQIYSSIKEENSGAAWWSNHWGSVTVIAIAVVIAIVTAGVAAAGVGSAASAALQAASINLEAQWANWSTMFAATEAVLAAEAAADSVAFLSTVILASAAGGAIAGGIWAGIGETYNYLRGESNASNIMIQTNLPYTDGDLRTAYFAYDANLMMQADSIGGEKNTDKSLLFKQHVDLNDSTKSDAIPTIITDFSSTSDKLYFGYDRCHRQPEVSNDPNLLKSPIAHSYDSHGECSYCHLKEEPLGVVYLDDEKKIVNYYTIENQEQLFYLASAFNGDNEEAYKLFENAQFKLIADINIAEGKAWTPIGSCTESFDDNQEAKSSKNWHPFRAEFDGQGHTISGLRTSEYTNYAGLFGYVETPGAGARNFTRIKNVKISNSTFNGNVAGTIAGYIGSEANARSIEIDKVCADSSVMVIASGKTKESYAGGFAGGLRRYNHGSTEINIRNCYSNASIVAYAGENQAENMLGTFVGTYIGETSNYAHSTIPTFENCYFGGYSISTQKAVGSFKADKDICAPFENCYSIGAVANEDGNNTPHYIERNYISSGHLAYDLMKNSMEVNEGDTTYYFTQKGNYPELTNTKQPTLCKVKVGERNTGVQIADTIININATKLAAPIEYTGQKFDKAILYGWNNENCEGDPIYKGQANDFSELYKTPTRYYALVLNPEDIPAIANVQNATEWKGAGVLAGYSQTNIMSDLYLQGSDAWSLQQAPQCIDGTNKIVITGMPLISDVNGSISSARKYFRARSNASRAQSETENITIQNMRLVGDVLTQDVLSKGNRSLTLNNLILQPINARKVTLDWNTKTQAENAQGYNFKNVICKQADSTSVAFYKNGSEVVTTTFSDEKKNNDYEHILNYMLSQDGMLDVFGLRLSGKNEKVAGKMGFATEENKRIYRVTLYSQATGLEDGEVLMNYDGDITFDVKGSRVGAMHEGVPAGTFAILPLTEAELGASFQYLGKNIITKDGRATCISLEDGQTDGFTYPSCFGSEIHIMANRGEYTRKVRRDGTYETLYLPFGLTSVETAVGEFSTDDQIDLCFVNVFEGKDGLSEDGKSFRLTSQGAYNMEKEALAVDSLTEDEVSIPGVPYLIRFKCKERTDEMSTVTFTYCDPRGNVLLMRSPDELDIFDPLFGLFQGCTATEFGKGKKVYGLEAFVDETTGEPAAKFVRLKDTDHLNAFHCYIATSSSLAGDEIKVAIDEGTSTGINTIKNSPANGKNKIYDMLGRRVNKMTPRNIYIQNGKKFINY